MKLHEIISVNEEPTKAILFENLEPYKRSLKTYFGDLYQDPMFMVVSVTNATCYVKIINAHEFYEAICAYLDVPYIMEEGEEGYDEEVWYSYEEINFNSFFLKQW